MDWSRLYGKGADEGKISARYRAVAEGYRAMRGEAPEAFFSSPGRAEIIGNHTDHNGGKVIVAAIGCDIVAAAGRRTDGVAEYSPRASGPCVSAFRRLRPAAPRRAGACRWRAASPRV